MSSAPGWASCQAEIASSQSAPDREVNEAGNRPVLLALHHPEDPVLLALPVRRECAGHLPDAPSRPVEAVVIDGADRFLTEVGDPLVLGDVVPDE